MAQGFSAAKAEVVFEGQCGFGDIRDQGELGMKEAIRRGDFVVLVVPREEEGGVWGAGLEIWVARYDLREGVVMGEGRLSSCWLMGFLTIPTCPSASSLKHG